MFGNNSNYSKWRIAILVIAIALFSHAELASAEAKRVLVVSSNVEGVFKEVSESIIKTVMDKGSSEIELSFYDPNKISPNESLSNYISSHDLIVTLGVKSTETISSLDTRPPLLATLIPLQYAKTLTQNSQQQSQWISAIVLDQPIERQLNLIKLLSKGNQSVGILLSPSSGYTTKDIEDLSRKIGINIYTEITTGNENIIRELGYILDKADILLAIPDPLIFNRQTAGSVLQSAYRRRIPVVGFSLSHVKAGAIAAVYSTPEQIGRHIGESIREYLLVAGRGISSIQRPKYFSISFNKQVERSLGLSLPDEHQVEEQMKSLEKTVP